MLDKSKRGALWIGVTVVWNLVFAGYLVTYTGGGGTGEFIGIFPEAFVVLVVLVGVIVLLNAVLGWYYLGKPDLSEVYKPEAPTKERPDEDVEPGEV